ncbi:conserved hypothetical protein [Vibrio crassostreae]|nr:conserved hypothetical protein [Vibrio chagasii]CAK2847176.1 conserved hypothetical protein [Vibrio crassostreae]
MIKSIRSLVVEMAREVMTRSDEWKLSLLNQFELTKPKLYVPSADGDLLLNWRTILDPYWYNRDFVEVNEFLAQVVQQHREEDDEFDFGLIDSLAASKSFGRGFTSQINGSWFRNVSDWGAGMFPSHEGVFDCRSGLSGLDEIDWEENLEHIRREGFNRERILVYYYDWLKRYECCNSGGSHHAAMLIHQIKTQNYSHTRKAEVVRCSLDTAPIKRMLEKGYVAFVTGEETFFAPDGSWSLAVGYGIQRHISDEVYEIPMGTCSPNQAKIIIFNKSNLHVPEGVFYTWYERQVKMGRIIPLLDLLENTISYCKTPYLHELDSIYLGDPLRRSDHALRNLLNRNGKEQEARAVSG